MRLQWLSIFCTYETRPIIRRLACSNSVNLSVCFKALSLDPEKSPFDATITWLLLQRMSNQIPTESIDHLLKRLVSSNSWSKAQEYFNHSNVIYVIGNGGNLAVADHASVDITRLSGKLGIAPGSGILATSVIGDSSFDDWFTNWLDAHVCNLDRTQLSKSMVIGVSSSGTANNICKCLRRANSIGMKALMISARHLDLIEDNFKTVCIGTDYYHTGEVVSLMLFYQLIHGSGSSCPTISAKLGKETFDRIANPQSIA